MSDLVKPVADAVVAALNAGSFSQSFTARKRYYDDKWYLKEQVKEIRVDVCPSRFGSTTLVGGGGQYSGEAGLDVVLRKPFTAEDKDHDGSVKSDSLEAMTELLGELHAFFMDSANRILAGNVGHTTPSEPPQIVMLYDPRLLPSQYNGVVRLTFTAFS